MSEQVRNIKLTVAYDGTAYHGFQRQANAMTIQQVLEERLTKIFGHQLKIIGAGRTDAGVHAYGQVVNFYTTGTIPADRIPLAAKGVLPADIVISSAAEVDKDFHARSNARSKVYLYRIYQSCVPDPFLRNYAWYIVKTLDIPAIQAAMGLIVGTHDFSSFRGSGGPPVNPVRTILAANCEMQDKTTEFSFWGTGFLYHMVRNLVGTLIDVGLGKLSAAGFTRILAARDRCQAGITAPAQGLYLKEVFY